MTYKDVDSIIEWFKEGEAPFYIIEGTKYRHAGNYNVSDIDRAADKLHKDLSLLGADDGGSKFTIFTFEKKHTDKIKSGDYVAACTYLVPKAEKPLPEGWVPREEYRGSIYQLLQQMEAKITSLETKLVSQEIEDTAEDDESIGEQAQPNYLGALIQSPQVQNVLSVALANMLSSFMPNKIQAVAGVPEVTIAPEQEQKIANALTTLAKHDTQLGDHLLKLADIAEADPGKFKFLLTML